MRRVHFNGLTVVLFCGIATMALGGCAAQYQRQITELKGDIETLKTELGKRQSQLAEAQLAKSTAEMQLQGEQNKLQAAQARIQALANGPAKSGTGITLADGQTPLYYKSLGGDLLFAAGKATLTAGGTKALNSVIAELKARHSGRVVRVYGYTDSDPILKSRKLWQDNLDLSANRAMAVARYLSGKGIKDDLIETIAMGSARPVAENKSAAGKAKNRRVEIVVVKK